MGKYILKYNGEASFAPEEDITHITQSKQMKVLDDSALPKMVLVELDPDCSADMLKSQLPHWKVFPQNIIQKPDTKKKLKKK
jgi:hypothetical protein